jgi:DcmR-like sensory protein
VVQAAFETGAHGYVVKTYAGSDLLPAVAAVLQGEQFISASLPARDSNAPKDDLAAAIRRRHEVAFHADDDSLVDGYGRFIESALKSGNAVIVVVTEAHRAGLLRRLEADGVDVTAAIKQGSYVPLDAADALLRLIVNDMPDHVRCRKVIGDLVMGTAKGVKGKHSWVVVCGEIAPTRSTEAMWRGQFSSNTCGTRSRKATEYILCVGIYGAPFLTEKAAQSSGESARNTHPFRSCIRYCVTDHRKRRIGTDGNRQRTDRPNAGRV